MSPFWICASLIVLALVIAGLSIWARRFANSPPPIPKGPRPEAHGCYEEIEADYSKQQRIRQAIARERAEMERRVP